jgi:predicted DsbA family dithiol-disulfide isomerase
MKAREMLERHDGAQTLAPRAPRLRVWIDFVCPYCFLAEVPLREATQGLNVIIEWMPFELRPYPQPTLRPEGEYLQTVWRRSVYPLAEALGVPIRLPPVSPQPYSRLAFEGLQFAREHHKSDEYVDATLRAFFQEGLDIGQPQVLHDIARRVGLPDEAFAAALQQRRYAEAHKAALEQARETGIRAVPTLIVGEHRIEGMPSSEALRRAIGTSRVSVDSRIATPPGSE